MADESGLSPFVFACQGGLVLDQSTFAMQPGMALELQNFEPDIRGDYGRISGYTKWNDNIVQDAASTEKVLMSAYFKGKVIAARGHKAMKLARQVAGRRLTQDVQVQESIHFRYTLAGTEYIVWADGANNAGWNYITDISSSAPADPQFVTGFKDALFFAGMSSTRKLVFTAPFTDDDFSAANGAGTIRVDSDTGLFPFQTNCISSVKNASSS